MASKPLHDFKVGDIARKIHGKKLLEVTSAYPNSKTIWAKYIDTGRSPTAYYYDIVLVDNEQTGESKMEKQLYMIKDGENAGLYATYLATNSSGQMVMEVKTTGTIVTLSAAQVEEVVPFTFTVRFQGNEKNFSGEKDKVSVGDYLLFTGDGPDGVKIGTVIKLDTKVKSAPKFKGKKLVTTDL